MDLYLNYLAESNLKKKIQKYNKFQTKKSKKKKTQKKNYKKKYINIKKKTNLIGTRTSFSLNVYVYYILKK